MKEIVYLVGLPASGKTTYRKTHFPECAVISNDEVTEAFAAQNGLSYAEAWQHLSSRDVREEGLKRFDQAVRNGQNIVIDNTNLTAEARAMYRAEGYILKAVVFNLDEAERLKRAQKRKHGGGKCIPESVVREMREKYAPPSAEEGFKEIVYVAKPL